MFFVTPCNKGFESVEGIVKLASILFITQESRTFITRGGDFQNSLRS